MDAYVVAGGTPEPGDPLYPITQGRPRAMLDMGGQPMVRRVIDALLSARQVEKVIVVGLDDPADQEQLHRPGVAAFLPDQGGMVANGASALEWFRRHRPENRVVLGCSADIPHLEGHMVDGLVEECRPYDRLFYFGMITRERMEAAYPGSNRTYATFKGGIQAAGADIWVVQTAVLETDSAPWNKVIEARKNPFVVARVVGFSTLVKLAFRRLSIQEAAAIAGRVLGADRPVGVVHVAYPEMAMDADKPHQVEMLRRRFGG